MKTRIVPIFIFICFATSIRAQISLEHTYVTDQPNQSEQFTVNLSESGYKYVAYHSSGMTMEYFKLYNTDHSVFKTIQVPQISGWYVHALKYISETLFDLDSLVEYLVCYQSNTGSNYQTFVFNENGDTLLYVPGGFWTLGITTIPPPIVSLGDSTKLILMIGGMTPNSTKVYSLPGRLPCCECNNIPNIANEPLTTDIPSFQKYKDHSSPYPNPTNSAIKIKYKLPTSYQNAYIKIYNITNQLIGNFKIDSTYDEIILSNNDLPSGEYFYSIEVDNLIIEKNNYILIK